MSGPLIFVGTYTIQEGKAEETAKRLRELVDFVDTNEPRMIAFNVYLDEAGTRATCVQVHPDAASMETHLELIGEHLSTAFDYLEGVESEQAYGPCSPGLETTMRAYAAPDALTLLPVHEAGFTRTSVR